jgi:hypothetical protein
VVRHVRWHAGQMHLPMNSCYLFAGQDPVDREQLVSLQKELHMVVERRSIKEDSLQVSSARYGLASMFTDGKADRSSRDLRALLVARSAILGNLTGGVSQTQEAAPRAYPVHLGHCAEPIERITVLCGGR